MNKPLMGIGMALAIVAGLAAFLAAQQPNSTANPNSANQGPLRIVAEDTAMPLAKKSAVDFQTLAGISVGVAPRDYSRDRLAKLLAGEADVLLTARPLSRDEANRVMQESGKAPILRVIARDAIAVYVYRNNPVKSLSLPLLRRIYTGELKNWTDLRVAGALNKPIVVIAPPKNSDTVRIFGDRVMKGDALGADVQFASSVAEIVDRMPGDVDAIGFGSWSFGLNNDLIGVAELPSATDENVSVRPTAASVGGDNPAYPLIQVIYAYTLGRPKGAQKQWLDWLISDAGQAKIAEWGYFKLR